MELQLKKKISEYRLVFFQPDPENGERLCIALLFEDDGRRDLLYDERFPRVQCFAPDFELSLLRFLMRSLKEEVGDRDLTIERILFSLGSQLSVSNRRLVASPITEKIKMQLLEQFVLHKNIHIEYPMLVEADSQKKQIEEEISNHLVTFTERWHVNGLQQIQHANVLQVTGKKIRGIESVSLMLVKDRNVTILDGIDLSVQTPKQALRRTGKVVHTFWQYRQLSQQALFDRRLRRVGVVLNGARTQSDEYRDARDFARDSFFKESDLVVDQMSESNMRELESLLVG